MATAIGSLPRGLPDQRRVVAAHLPHQPPHRDRGGRYRHPSRPRDDATPRPPGPSISREPSSSPPAWSGLTAGLIDAPSHGWAFADGGGSARRRGAGPGGLRVLEERDAAPHASSRHLPVESVHRHQRRHLPGLRRPRRGAVPPARPARAGGRTTRPSRRGPRCCRSRSIMLAFSARSGALATRIGPRLQMAVGPVVVGAGMVLLRLVGPSGALPHRGPSRPSSSWARASPSRWRRSPPRPCRRPPPTTPGWPRPSTTTWPARVGSSPWPCSPWSRGSPGQLPPSASSSSAGFRTAVVISGVAAAAGGVLAAAPDPQSPRAGPRAGRRAGRAGALRARSPAPGELRR